MLEQQVTSGNTIVNNNSAIITSFSSDFDASQSLSSQSSSRQLASQNYINELKEVHYIPNNTTNSPTIYSYQLWKMQKRVLIATKENYLKEIYFKHTKSINKSNEFGIANDDNYELADKTPLISNSNNINDLQVNEITTLNLEPVIKINKFSKISKEAIVSSIDIIDMNEFCVLTVAFVIVSISIYI